VILRDLSARGWKGVISVECIGQVVQRGGDPRPAYREISLQAGAGPVKPGLIGHPVFQTVALAYSLEHALDSIQED
jgi:hypothetical protein